ncbi:site-specific DNA-methyltransferase [Heliobacterium gestii]|uniref:Methyltransferase n=1 Tax=Heliomicrobium gestii TaxID=2699 RepID=A0A845LB78_HELGE|nr:DNA methyltransferase [Heliomicrobium gestii]MBM7867643.1 site-specific DNA-methyltransferase (adenine-specific) [Heliomicrobium gestii]MZP44037.1 site-specific DNA-methyltransferase [Heliomicrobium gestii]
MTREHSKKGATELPHPLMRNSNAPQNRTLFLEADDWQRYSEIPSIDELGCDNVTVHRPIGNEQFDDGRLDDERLDEGRPDDHRAAEEHHERWQADRIYCGDALAGLSRLPDQSVDLIFADPPYFGLKKDYGSGKRSNPWKRLDEYIEWNRAWLAEAARLLKPHGAIYVCCDWEYSGRLQELLSEPFKVLNRITWRREKGRGAAKNWKNNMEDIWFAVVDSAQYIFNLEEVKFRKEIIAPYTTADGKPKDWVETDTGERFRMTCPPNIWTDLTVPFWSMPENTPHPTQKPEKLVERCILASSHPGALVLDPFMGSGTTAAVARRLGRRFIGFETNEDYIRLALKRLDRMEQMEQMD